MNDLFLDIGYQAITKENENLCGDQFAQIKNEDNQVLVLADGLGSGVKASILATLTSKIISTMIASGLTIKDCLETIAKTLPTCKTRNIAYSTFSILHFINNDEVELIQYDNPGIILLRNKESYDFFKTEMLIDGKRIFYSRVKLQLGDSFIAISDGCVYAGVGKTLNFGWQRENIIEYLKEENKPNINAKTLAKILIDKCNDLYDNAPGDDSSALVVKVVKREAVNLLIGPSKLKSDTERMMSLFFAKSGKKIVCGGTTSQLAANYLKVKLETSLDYLNPDVPPMALIKGVDIVTEGILTINKVLEYAKDYLGDNLYLDEWSNGLDGASQIARMLFVYATDINFYVGKAVNPAHQNPDLPINFSIKMQLVDELSAILKIMGKDIKVSYF